MSDVQLKIQLDLAPTSRDLHGPNGFEPAEPYDLKLEGGLSQSQEANQSLVRVLDIMLPRIQRLSSCASEEQHRPLVNLEVFSILLIGLRIHWFSSLWMADICSCAVDASLRH